MVSCKGPTQRTAATGAGADLGRWSEDRARLVDCAERHEALIDHTLAKQKAEQEFLAKAAGGPP